MGGGSGGPSSSQGISGFGNSAPAASAGGGMGGMPAPSGWGGGMQQPAQGPVIGHRSNSFFTGGYMPTGSAPMYSGGMHAGVPNDSMGGMGGMEAGYGPGGMGNAFASQTPYHGGPGGSGTSGRGGDGMEHGSAASDSSSRVGPGEGSPGRHPEQQILPTQQSFTSVLHGAGMDLQSTPRPAGWSGATGVNGGRADDSGGGGGMMSGSVPRQQIAGGQATGDTRPTTGGASDAGSGPGGMSGTQG